MSKGYIFLCSNTTEDECLEKMLFGGPKNLLSKVGNLEIGDSLFLYNYNIGRLYGEFEATSICSLNIDENAWNGQFPVQVKVKQKNEYEPLAKSELQEVVTFGKHPQFILNESQLLNLERLFQTENRLPKFENDFREKFPAKYYTSDGHFVRSLGEVVIDNWLHNQWNLKHSYERKVPIKEPLYCDFTINSNESNERIYIEYWGLEDEKYLERKEYKKELYKKYNLKLVELIREDLEKLDDVFPEKIRLNIKNHIFN